jgi:hypothetical protein
VAAKNVIFKLDNLKKISRRQIFMNYNEEWASACNHVKEINYIENEHETDNILENFFINVGSSDSYRNGEAEDVCGIVS